MFSLGMLLALSQAGFACAGCYGTNLPGSAAEGPGGFNMARLRRVYSSGRQNRPAVVEMRPGAPGKGEVGEAIPVRVPTSDSRPTSPTRSRATNKPRT